MYHLELVGKVNSRMAQLRGEVKPRPLKESVFVQFSDYVQDDKPKPASLTVRYARNSEARVEGWGSLEI
jgi:hypothetical protein